MKRRKEKNRGSEEVRVEGREREKEEGEEIVTIRTNKHAPTPFRHLHRDIFENDPLSIFEAEITQLR